MGLNIKSNYYVPIFFFTYTLANAAVVISKVGIDQNYMLSIRYFCLIACLVVFGLTTINFTRKEILYLACVVFLSFLGVLVSRSTGILGLVVINYLALYCKRIDLKTIGKIILFSNVLLLIFFAPILYDSFIHYITDARYGLRYTYGFTHPNIMAMYLYSFYTSVVLFFFVIFKDKFLRLIFLTVVFVIFIYVIDVTKSRSSEGLLVLTYLGVVFSLFFSATRESKYFFHLVALFTLTIIIFQFYTVISYNPGMLPLDVIFSGRISLGNYLYKSTSLLQMFLGVDIEPFDPIDFFYIAFVFTAGIPLSLLTFIALFKRLKEIKLSMDLAIICFCSLASTLTERQFIIPLCSIAVFIVFARDISSKGKYNSSRKS